MIREYHTTRRTIVETRNADSVSTHDAGVLLDAQRLARPKRPVGRPRKTPRAPHAGSFDVIREPGAAFAFIDACVPVELADAMEKLFQSYRTAYR